MTVFALSDIKALPFDFEAEVAAFIQAKKDHLTQEGVPAPTAHHYVEAAVRRIPGSVQFNDKGKPMPETQTPDDFVPDYQIIDDTPPPPTADERKAAIAAQINAEAQALLRHITPPLKTKLWSIQQRAAAAALMAEKASDADHEVLEAAAMRELRSEAIQMHLAELESQLHDLPDDMVDIWKPEPFPQV